MTRLRNPSPAMIVMLENVATGLPTTAGLRGRSEHGGATQTEASLRRRGLLDQKGVTAEGYAAIARSRSTT